MTYFPKIMKLLQAQGADDIVVFGGGIVPEDDLKTLTAAGVAKIFTPGASTEDIVQWVRDNVRPKSA